MINHLNVINYKILTILVIFQILLTSCTLNQPKVKKVSDISQLFKIQGLLLLPPKGDDWVYVDSSYAIMFHRNNAERTLSNLAGVKLVDLPVSDTKSEEEFYHAVIKERDKAKDLEDSSRYKDISIKESIFYHRDTLCVRIQATYKDSVSKYLPPSVKYFVLNDLEVLCRHPYISNKGVHIVFSYRALPQDNFDEPMIIADDFIENVIFEGLLD